MMDDMTDLMNEYLPLRDVVFQTLRKAILKGELQPGERLMEVQLANRLGVSRTPIREAIRKLELEGLVTMIPRRGAEVAEITEKNMRDVLEVRRALEELAVKIACEKITEEELERLGKVAKKFRNVMHGDDLMKITEADVEFHEALAAASHSEVFEVTLQLFISMISDFRNRFYSLSDYISQARESHMAIYEAVRDRDVAKARYEVERHLLIAQSFIEQHPEL